MRAFDFKTEYNKLLTPEVVAYLTQIHEYKGQQNLFIEAKADALSELLEVAKIQSTEASNRIEGIITTDDRLKKIVRDKTMPKTRSEKEIAGYRDVLATIHESHDYIPPKPSIILQLHRDLYKYSGKSIGGSFKNSDNVIAEELPDGGKDPCLDERGRGPHAQLDPQRHDLCFGRCKQHIQKVFQGPHLLIAGYTGLLPSRFPSGHSSMPNRR